MTSTDRLASLADELEIERTGDMFHLLPDDVVLIIEALRTHLYEDVIGKHSGRSQHREWWNGSEWLYPGDEVVSRRRPT